MTADQHELTHRHNADSTLQRITGLINHNNKITDGNKFRQRLAIVTALNQHC